MAGLGERANIDRGTRLLEEGLLPPGANAELTEEEKKGLAALQSQLAFIETLPAAEQEKLYEKAKQLYNNMAASQTPQPLTYPKTAAVAAGAIRAWQLSTVFTNITTLMNGIALRTDAEKLEISDDTITTQATNTFLIAFSLLTALGIYRSMSAAEPDSPRTREWREDRAGQNVFRRSLTDATYTAKRMGRAVCDKAPGKFLGTIPKVVSANISDFGTFVDKVVEELSPQVCLGLAVLAGGATSMLNKDNPIIGALYNALTIQAGKAATNIEEKIHTSALARRRNASIHQDSSIV